MSVDRNVQGVLGDRQGEALTVAYAAGLASDDRATPAGYGHRDPRQVTVSVTDGDRDMPRDDTGAGMTTRREEFGRNPVGRAT